MASMAGVRGSNSIVVTQDGGGLLFPRAWAVLRLLAAALAIAATVEQVRLAGQAASSAGIDPGFAVGRLFTFFTVLSNVTLIVVFVIAGVWALTRREDREPNWLAVLLASMSTYMLVTGLVYNLVLRAVGDADIMGGWSNSVHHVIGPAFVLVDVLFAPRRRALPWRAVLWGLAFPLAWVMFTLVSGPFRVSTSTGTPPWYPYPFLDPATAGGFGGVALWIAGIAALFALLMTGVVGMGRWRTRRS
jgi:hypothetical protein